MSRSKKKISAIFYHFFLYNIIYLGFCFHILDDIFIIEEPRRCFFLSPKIYSNPVQWKNYSEVMKGSLPFLAFYLTLL